MQYVAMLNVKKGIAKYFKLINDFQPRDANS